MNREQRIIAGRVKISSADFSIEVEDEEWRSFIDTNLRIANQVQGVRLKILWGKIKPKTEGAP